MSYLFVYGTLQDLDVLKLVLGHHDFILSDYTLLSYRIVRAKDEDFPLLVKGEGKVEGKLIKGLSPKDKELLIIYEGEEFILKKIGPEIETFLPSDSSLITDEPWSLENWDKENYLKKVDRFLKHGIWE